ncbi:hypothetical protein BDW62DRAFT_197911 [Aspergillus aurantiobrunneus]
MSQKLIALPGGTGTIGRTILRALLAHAQYKPIILSRATANKTNGSCSITTFPESPIPPIETRYVDYASTTSLTTALTGIDTVISTLLIPGPEWVTYQLNLLHASIAAGVRRLAPSEFALSQKAHHEVDIDAGKIIVWNEVKRAVAEGKIDAAAFPVGMFMNYLAIGIHDTEKEREALAGFGEGPLMFHLGDELGPWIEVPVTETGAYPEITMTDIRDVGRFVVAALGFEEPWGGRELGIAGDTRSIGDVVDGIRGVLGEVDVRKLSREDLERRLEGLEEGDILERMEVQYMMACGRGGSVVDGVLNRLCPEIKPTSIPDFVRKYWS